MLPCKADAQAVAVFILKLRGSSRFVTGLSYYNSMTTWISLDKVLEIFDLQRSDLCDTPKVTAAIRRLSRSRRHWTFGSATDRRPNVDSRCTWG